MISTSEVSLSGSLVITDEWWQNIYMLFNNTVWLFQLKQIIERPKNIIIGFGAQ